MPTIDVDIDDGEITIEYDDEVVWISDDTDAMHPGTVTLWISDIPKIIDALQKIYQR